MDGVKRLWSGSRTKEKEEAREASHLVVVEGGTAAVERMY